MKRQYIFRLVAIALIGVAWCTGCTTSNRNAEGIRYFGQAQYDRAMTAFQAALSADPENPDSYYNIAATYHQSAKISLQSGLAAQAQQQYDQADQYYRLCLAKNPNHTAAYRGLAVLFMECRHPEAAFNLLLGWEQANPTSTEPKIELARLYQEFAQICTQQGRAEDAANCQATTLQYLEKVLTVDPGNFRALRALGHLKEQGGDIVGAISDYRRSLQSNPGQKDLETRITALEQGAGYTPAPVTSPVSGISSGISTTGATVYSGSSQTALGSVVGRPAF